MLQYSSHHALSQHKHNAPCHQPQYYRKPGCTFLGQVSRNSIVDVPWVTESPLGKLPYTRPAIDSDYDIHNVNLTQSGIDTPGGWQVDYFKARIIGYRHFETFNITSLYGFGSENSYTSLALESALGIKRLAANITVELAVDAEL